MPSLHVPQGQPKVGIAFWRVLLLSAALATLTAPVETHGSVASTPRPIRSSYTWIADGPRQLRLRGGADSNESSLQMRVVRDSVKVMETLAMNPVPPTLNE